MKKTLLLAGLLLLGGSTTALTAQTAFEWDFSEGLEGFTTYDVDERTPTSAAAQYGFAPGVAWVTMNVNRNPAAVSNSSYSPIGMAEDWLVTPAITVGEGQTLMFKTMTYSLSSSTKIGKLDVRISTTGNAIEDFTEVLEENFSVRYTQQTLSYDMSAYAGKTIYLAFVNVSMQKDFLIIDDIFVGIPPVAELDLNYTRLQGDATSGGQRISGSVTAGGSTTINEYTATLTCGDFTTSRTYEGLNVQPNAVHTFTFNESLPAPTAGVPQEFTVDVTINGGETISEEGAIYTQEFQPTKRVVVEELTGTWCGWCVRGIYYMELMNETYPDNFIGIAVHGGDPMQENNYMSWLQAYTIGYPFCMAMRNTTTSGDPMNIPSFYNTHISNPGWADISVYAEWADAEKKSIHTMTNTTFATSGELGMRLVLVVIENDVHNANGANYEQDNYYSGGSYGALGGYENMPSTIPASQMYYQEVARAAYDNVQEGIANSIPTYVEKGVTNKYYRELDVPTNVLVADNCQIVAMLIDYNSGEIVNAAKCDISAFNSAVNSVNNDRKASKAYRTYEGIRVETNLATASRIDVQVFSADGKLVFSAAPRIANGLTTIDCPINGNGVYIVRVAAGNNVETHKVIL